MENKFQLKPSDRASIDFAEEERLKGLGEDGAIIHEKDLHEGLAREKYTLNQECYSSGQTISGNNGFIDISSSVFEFTVPRDSSYFFLFSIVYNSSSGTCEMRMQIDGVSLPQITFSNSNTNEMKIIGGFAKLTAGTHTFKIQAQQNQTNATGTIQAYTTNRCYVMEV